MTARRWIAAVLAIVLAAGLGITILKHKAKRHKLEFNRQIAPIVYAKCAKCHYPGSAAPFALTSYREVRNHARAIGRALDRGLMPPWKPERGFGEFLGDNSLTDQEKDMLKQWLAEGCREGNSSKQPVPPKPPSQWPLGPPDDILQMNESYKISAGGNDIYRCFVIPTNYPEDRWVRGADVVPGDPKVVHHMFLFVDTSGGGRARDGADGSPGFTAFGGLGFPTVGQLGLWAPGVVPHPLPDGTGYFLPKGADIILQVHYHPIGKEETDLSRVGLYFCKQPVDKRVRCMPIAVPPHMHLVGRAIEAGATLPDQTFVPIVRITDWDSRWQNFYTLKPQLRLPAGSRVRLEARYDNSSSNPRNPNNPPADVKFGVHAVDEMCIVYLLYTVDSERLTQGKLARNCPDTFLNLEWGKPLAGRK